MTVDNLQSALNKRPFRPFEIRVDGETVRVDHPEQVMVGAKSQTVVYLDREEHIHIFEIENIRKIRIISRNGKQGAAK